MVYSLKVAGGFAVVGVAITGIYNYGPVLTRHCTIALIEELASAAWKGLKKFIEKEKINLTPDQWIKQFNNQVDAVTNHMAADITQKIKQITQEIEPSMDNIFASIETKFKKIFPKILIASALSASTIAISVFFAFYVYRRAKQKIKNAPDSPHFLTHPSRRVGKKPQQIAQASKKPISRSVKHLPKQTQNVNCH